jgi:hypothetical protein
MDFLLGWGPQKMPLIIFDDNNDYAVGKDSIKTFRSLTGSNSIVPLSSKPK